MSNKLTVRKVEGGYIMEGYRGEEAVLLTLEDVCDYLLMKFEGRCSSFTGSSYGKVTISRGDVDVKF